MDASVVAAGTGKDEIVDLVATTANTRNDMIERRLRMVNLERTAAPGTE